jgi:beta-mannosidase
VASVYCWTTVQPSAIARHDLAALDWTLTGFTPFQWQFEKSMELGQELKSEIPPIPARVPGSVQLALREAGLLPDWNLGLNARQCEWAENRHWAYTTTLPATWWSAGQTVRLHCEGLDYAGWIMLNGREVGRFTGSFVPHRFDLTPHLGAGDNRLQIIFDCPPRWLGQFGFTSQITEWKPRFNYTWDWTARLVQAGIWDAIRIEVSDGREVLPARCWTDGDRLHVVTAGGRMRLTLADGARVLRTGEFVDTLTWDNLPVERWWPNGHGTQKLYTVTCVPVDGGESRSWRVGFKAVRWEPCAGAPAGADPWLCVVNDRPIFLQGVNWSPIRPNFADVTEAEVRTRLETYRDLGCNVLRVWGGAVLEKESFYNACDELGLLVWQEFPLSSSGADNWPPEDPRAIDEMAAIAASYIERRQHHVSLLLWCGGNELQGDLEGGKTGCGKPVTNDHPLIGRLAATVARLDPSRRFLPSSASGPRFVADAKDFGNGLHWDVHGPWRGETEEYWQRDDALFRSEVGAPGASPAAVINQYAGGLPVLPGSLANPLWRRVSWWLEWPEFLAEQGREPRDLEEFVAWSQQRQAVFLTRAVAACQGRFPRCGGIILWMGHDSFPCPTNTAILDFHGQEKPAALAVGKLFRAHASQLARTPAADAG